MAFDQAEYDRTRYRENPERRAATIRSATERQRRLRAAKDPEFLASARAATKRSYRRHAEKRRADRRRYSRTPEAKAKAAATAREWRRRNPGRRRGQRPETREFTLILLRDPCAYCGGSAAEIDHIEPISAGGSREWENCTASCGFCNRSKKDRRLLAWLARQAA